MTSALVRPEASATIGPVLITPAHDIVHPAVTVYSRGWESTETWIVNDGWVTGGGFGALTIASTAQNHTPGGSASSFVTRASGTSNGTVFRTFSGLTIGRSYTASVWLYASTASGSTASIGVTGIGDSAATTAATSWSQRTYTFTATGTSHQVVVTGIRATSGSWNLYFDDITLTRDQYTEHVPDEWGDVVLPVPEGKATMDDSWSPYVQAVFDVPLTGLDLVEQIDPKTDQRVVIEATEAMGSTTRTFDLGLRKRTVDHKGKTITVELASDEALLIDKRRVADTVDTTPRTYEDSLRDICDWALDKIGAGLEAGTDDADLTAAWAGTNLMPNPSGEVDTSGWVAGGSGGTIARVSGGHTGSYCIRVSNAAAGYTAGPFFTTAASSGVRVEPGKTYTTTCWVRSNRAVSVRLAYQWAPPTSSGATTANPLGTTVALVANTWAKLTMSATVPQNVDRFGPYVYLASGTYPASSWIDIDEVLVYESSEELVYFDGSTAADALYTYEWDATAHNSVSRRVPIVERPRELFAWKPGVSLWDFLQPLFEASGLRLFCDEQRAWRLINPETYEVDGYVLVQEGHNATEGDDTIDRNEEGLWADGVVCVYRWTDALGIQQEAYDYAGADGKVHTVTYEDTPFPGAGAAAYILARMQGRGRQQEVTALTKYTATPGQDVVINLPGTLPQTGKVQSVIFDLGTGLMEVRTRGLTDALEGSWAAWDPDETWSDVSGSLLWKDA